MQTQRPALSLDALNETKTCCLGSLDGLYDLADFLFYFFLCLLCSWFDVCIMMKIISLYCEEQRKDRDVVIWKTIPWYSDFKTRWRRGLRGVPHYPTTFVFVRHRSDRSRPNAVDWWVCYLWLDGAHCSALHWAAPERWTGCEASNSNNVKCDVDIIAWNG